MAGFVMQWIEEDVIRPPKTSESDQTSFIARRAVLQWAK
jgi:hypothetical protein